MSSYLVSLTAGWLVAIAGGQLADDRNPAQPPSLDALVQRLDDADPKVRVQTVLAIARLGTDALPAKARLTQALKDEQRHVRGASALALGAMGAQAADCVPAILKLLDEKDKHLQRCVLAALVKIGPAAKDAIPVIVTYLDDEDFHTQYWACRALGSMGPAAKVATEDLIRWMADGVTSVRRNAAAALGNIGPAVGEQAIDPLIQAMRDRTYPVREDAVVALGKLAPVANKAAAELRRALADKSYMPRSHAAKSLWLISGDAECAVAVLIEELNRQNAPCAAAEMLAQMGPSALPAKSALVAKLHDEEPDLRLAAVLALGKIGRPANDAIPAMKELLLDDDQLVQEAAAEAIRQITASSSPSEGEAEVGGSTADGKEN